MIVGFALETTDVLASARRKLDAKGLDLVVANDATEPGAGFGHDTNRVTLVSATGDGFGHDTNRVTLVSATGDEALPLLDKRAVATAILDRVAALLATRAAS